MFACLWQVVVVGQMAFSAHKFEAYPVRPAGEYAVKRAGSGLTVAVDPVDSLDKQKAYFDSRLTNRGILPVLVVVQNDSPSETYIFDSSALGLGEPAEASGKGGRKTAALLGSGGLIELTQVKEVTEVRENMMKRGIRSKMLPPGATVSGFIYVPVPTDAARGKIHLQVPLTRAGSGEVDVINLVF